ncbi:sn-glycerol 3-phosphate transport system ATP-binding protein/multiple sugar transport system ATP-binding protein [Asanoa hainanensis]|uniref:sn-glycerol 3-phosphate transport system ATP-binding protein/multiple sugar transport system ATP-binding protein n=1 Tax=Asanoa hainanensis TaxID=560556 RepID=A0A239P134_9ACTN|nr:ABC transporter ATP-binding protein [Asanoa hainanensis]SNT60847.1 sn-glycerol 3-phosphate transport system ATP-binding protein/multiple sugar transport system ATP-binding protein [Asanoa hainanensis]
MTSIRLDYVTKVFPGGAVALDGVDLSVRDGELLVLVGPSGCGKSTVLRIIAGLEDATSGSVQVDGVEIDGVPPKMRDVAMVFQNYALYPHMTVADNLGFALRLRHVAAAERTARVDETAHMLEIRELLERKPKALSGGQRQRVAMGRALVRDPRILLMDEPLSNLDAKLRVAMRAELRRLHERFHTTTVYVTHDQVEAMTLGDRIAVLHEGRVQQVGAPG